MDEITEVGSGTEPGAVDPAVVLGTSTENQITGSPEGEQPEGTIETQEGVEGQEGQEQIPEEEQAASYYQRYRNGLVGIAKLIAPDRYTDFLSKPVNERFDAISQAVKDHVERLQNLEADGELVGVKIDAPAESWDPVEQVNELPPNHKTKLINEIFANFMPDLVEQVLADPQGNPEEYKYVNTAATTMAQKIYQRPIEEINAIMTLTQHIPSTQLQEIIQRAMQPGGFDPSAQPYGVQPSIGGQPFVGQPYAVQPNGNGYQIQPLLLQSAQRAGLDIDTPETKAAVTAFAPLVGQLFTERDGLVKRLTDIESQLKETGTRFQEQSFNQVSRDIDGKAEAVRKGALATAINGRAPQGMEEEIRDLIDAKAERLMKADPQLQIFLQTAKDWQKDAAGNPAIQAKVERQIALYSAKVNALYAQAAGSFFKNFIIPKSDAQRASDVTRGKGPALVDTSQSPGSNAGTIDESKTISDLFAKYRAEGLSESEIAMRATVELNRMKSTGM